MRSSLGISLGAANLTAVADGRATVRRAILTLSPHHPPSVGTPTAAGLTVTGFVDRVGDPVPLVAADGSSHHADRLAAAAIEAFTRVVSPRRRPEVSGVAVPAHWPQSAVSALRARLPHLTVVSDAVAALTALQTNPGLPTRGVVALCDFGATGSSITLADAGNGFAVIGQSVRCDDFSGDLIDQALLHHVLADLDVDPTGTSAVASLVELREQCQAAKERLTVETATALMGGATPIRLTRNELERVVRAPLDAFVEVLLDTLHRNRIAPAQLSAIATVGGGARIPVVTQRLSEFLRLPVTTTPYAQAVAAIGAELLALRGAEREARTVLVAAADRDDRVAAAVPLAWSAETDLAAAPVVQPVHDAARARPAVHFDHQGFDVPELEPLPWYRCPGVLFAGAACFAALAVTGLLLTTSHAGQAGTVAVGAGGISAPVAKRPLEVPARVAAPPAPPVVTETVVVAAPAPRVVQAPPEPGRAVNKQAAPQPVPLPVAPPPSTAQAAPEPSPEPEPAPVTECVPAFETIC